MVPTTCEHTRGSRLCTAIVALMWAGAAFASVRAAFAQGSDCSAVAPTTITMESLPAVEVQVDSSKSIADLRAMAERDSEGRHIGLTLGYYRAGARYRYTINADGRGLGTSGVCVAVKTLTVRFGLNRRITYVSREVHDYPCIREMVVAHEQLHARADDEILGFYIADLKAALELEYGTGLVVKASTPDESRKTLKRILDGRLERGVEELELRRRQTHQRIDERDEEAALVAACGGEADSFLKRYRRNP